MPDFIIFAAWATLFTVANIIVGRLAIDLVLGDYGNDIWKNAVGVSIMVLLVFETFAMMGYAAAISP